MTCIVYLSVNLWVETGSWGQGDGKGGGLGTSAMLRGQRFKGLPIPGHPSASPQFPPLFAYLNAFLSIQFSSLSLVMTSWTCLAHT